MFGCPKKIFGRATIYLDVQTDEMGAQSSHIQFFSSCGRCVAKRPRVRLVVRPGAFGRASGRPNVRPDVRTDGRRRRPCRQRRRKKKHLIEAAPFSRLDQIIAKNGRSGGSFAHPAKNGEPRGFWGLCRLSQNLFFSKSFNYLIIYLFFNTGGFINHQPGLISVWVAYRSFSSFHNEKDGS